MNPHTLRNLKALRDAVDDLDGLIIFKEDGEPVRVLTIELSEPIESAVATLALIDQPLDDFDLDDEFSEFDDDWEVAESWDVVS